MEKEDRELLLQDLCARLPYGVICEGKYFDVEYDIDGGIEMFDVHDVLEAIFMDETEINAYRCDIETVKPYLRSMSSMTKEEKEELKTLFDAKDVTNDSICYLEGGTLEEYLSHISYSFCSKIIDWLNKYHFDYRGLIPKGLAIEAPEDIYKKRK